MSHDDHDDEFYMILPSNGCKDTHPENEANKFTTSWEQPIEMNQGWKVALTEANFSYTMTSINTSFGIRYEKLVTVQRSFKGKIHGDVAKRQVQVDFPDLPFPPPLGSSHLEPFKAPKVRYFAEDVNDLVFTSDMPFSIVIMGVRFDSCS